MIDIYSKYNDIHKNEMFYVLIWINDHIISCIIYILSHAHNKLTLGESYLPMMVSGEILRWINARRDNSRELSTISTWGVLVQKENSTSLVRSWEILDERST